MSLNVIFFIISTIILIHLAVYKDHPVFNDLEYESTFFSCLTPTQRWYSLVVLVIVGYFLSFWLKTSVKANMKEGHIYKLPTQYEYITSQRQNDYLKPDTVQGLEEWKSQHQVKVKPSLKTRFQDWKKGMSTTTKPQKSKGGIIYGKLP